MRSLDRLHIGQKLAFLGGLVTLLFLAPSVRAAPRPGPMPAPPGEHPRLTAGD